MRKAFLCSLLMALTFGLVAAEKGKDLAAEKEALADLQTFVGGWRGAGQIRRGSTQGAWSEEADWSWCFFNGHASLQFKSPEGKYFSKGNIQPSGKPGHFTLVATLPDGKTEERFSGEREEDRLTLVAEKPAEDRPAQITIRLVAGGDRMIVLFERQLPGTERFTRLSEVGYTRKGSGFGSGVSFPECVVTGGFATMSVDYKGQKYPICCEGCRDLFQMDPEGVLAEYRQRKAEERAKPKK